MKRISVGSKLFMFENIYYVFLYVLLLILFLGGAGVAFVARINEDSPHAVLRRVLSQLQYNSN